MAINYLCVPRVLFFFVSPIVVHNLVAVAVLWRLHHKLCYACHGVIRLCMRREVYFLKFECNELGRK